MTTTLPTTARVLTPSGRGAIAVIQVVGPNAIDAVSDCFHSAVRCFSESRFDSLRFGRWENEFGEELVVVRLAEQEVEIHCHGGSAASEAILKSLSSRGVRTEETEFGSQSTKRTSLQVDALEALLAAPTEKVAACLFDQFEGALDEAIELILHSIQANEYSVAVSKIEKLLSWKHHGRVLTQPWRVVLAGPPNVGKSSLLNALVGYERAIVFDQPGTTRDVVTTTTAIDGWPIQLSDTAGLRETDEPIEAAGVQLARETLLTSDLVLILIEATQIGTAEANQFIDALNEHLSDATPRILVASKSDLAHETSDNTALATSTLKQQGIAELLSAISQKLVPSVPQKGEALPFRKWHFDSLQSAHESMVLGKKELAMAEMQSLLARTPR